MTEIERDNFRKWSDEYIKEHHRLFKLGKNEYPETLSDWYLKDGSNEYRGTYVLYQLYLNSKD